MKFKVTIEKLKKGWMFTLPVDSQRKGRILITELQDRDKENGEKPVKLAKLKGVVEKVGSSYFVAIYRSKLKQGQELVKELYIRARRENA